MIVVRRLVDQQCPSAEKCSMQTVRKIAATVTTVKDRGSQMNNISWRVFTKGKVWYWEREDNFTVLRTGPFSSFSACAADAKRSKKDDLESDKLFKVAKRPNRKYESKSTASQQRAN